MSKSYIETISLRLTGNGAEHEVTWIRPQKVEALLQSKQPIGEFLTEAFEKLDKDWNWGDET
jgi:hypothetical protein